MNMQMTRLQAGLALLCASLLTLTIIVLAVPISTWTPPALHPTAAADRVDTATTFEPPPLSSFPAFEARPVFSPSRTPIAPSDDASDDNASGSIADLTLVGIISDGAARLAIIRASNHPLAVSVAAGDEFDGWQVSRIDTDRVILRGKGAEQELKMSPQRLTASPGSGQ